MSDDLLSKIVLGAVSGLIFVLVGPFIMRHIAGIESSKDVNKADAKPNEDSNRKNPSAKTGSNIQSEHRSIELKFTSSIEKLNSLRSSGIFTEEEVNQKALELKTKYEKEVDNLKRKYCVELVESSESFQKLSDLHQNGVLNEDEFKKKKETLVSSCIQRQKTAIDSGDSRKALKENRSLEDNMAKLDKIIADLSKLKGNN